MSVAISSDIPGGGRFVLAGARVHSSVTQDFSARLDADGFALADIAIADGRISSIAAHGRSAIPAGAVELAGRIVLPCFVDCHTHIDKGHIWPRKPNPDGTFLSALNASGADRAARWSAEDVARRMDFSLRSAYAHGTKALRTHLINMTPAQRALTWPAFSRLRCKWAGKVSVSSPSAGSAAALLPLLQPLSSIAAAGLG